MVDRDPKIKVIYYLVGFLDIFSHLLSWLPSLVCLFLSDLGLGETQSRRFSADQNTHPPIGNLIIAKLFYSQFRQWPCLIPLDQWLPLSGIIRPTLFLCIFQNCKKKDTAKHTTDKMKTTNKIHTHICVACMVPFGMNIPQRPMGKMRLVIHLLKDARCLVKLRPLSIPSTVERVSGIIAAIRGQVKYNRILWWGLFTYN